MVGRIAKYGGDAVFVVEQRSRNGAADAACGTEDSDMMPGVVGSIRHRRDRKCHGSDYRNVTTYAGSVSRTDSPLPPFDPVCPMATFPIQIGGKWTAMIVMCLQAGPRRFGVLRRHLRPISAKVLAETLLAMERDGLVRRRLIKSADDAGVEYELTPLGRTLIDLIENARTWARTHLNELSRAREDFDRTDAAP